MALTSLQIDEQIAAFINQCISEHGNAMTYAALIRNYYAGQHVEADTPPIHRPPTGTSSGE